MIIRELITRLGFSVDERALDRIDSRMDRLRGALGQLAGLFAAVGAGLGVSELVRTASTFEQLEIQLRAVMGTAAEGDKAFAWIKRFATDTPFDVEQTANAFITLKNSGLDPTDGSLQALADTAAKYTRGSDGLTRVLMQLTQAYGKGKIQAEDMNVLVEAGVPVWDALAAATGDSRDQVQAFASAGKYGKEEVVKLIAALGDMSSGLSEAKMKSMAGQWSNFGDNIANTVDDFRKAGGFKFLTDALSGVNAWFSRIAKNGSLRRFLEGASEVAILFGQALKLIGRMLAKLGGWLSDVTEALGGIKNALKLAAIGAGAFYTVMGAIAAYKAIQSALLAMQIALAFTGVAWWKTAFAAVAAQLAMLWPIALAIAAIAALFLVIEDLYYWLTGTGDSLIGEYLGTWEGFKLRLLGIWVQIQDAIGGSIESIGLWFSSGLDYMKSLWDGFVQWIMGGLGSVARGILKVKEFFTGVQTTAALTASANVTATGAGAVQRSASQTNNMSAQVNVTVPAGTNKEQADFIGRAVNEAIGGQFKKVAAAYPSMEGYQP